MDEIDLVNNVREVPLKWIMSPNVCNALESMILSILEPSNDILYSDGTKFWISFLKTYVKSYPLKTQYVSISLFISIVIENLNVSIMFFTVFMLMLICCGLNFTICKLSIGKLSCVLRLVYYFTIDKVSSVINVMFELICVVTGFNTIGLIIDTHRNTTENSTANN